MRFDFGSFVVSLDFELLWGVLDHSDIYEYMDNITGVRAVIPRLLDLFRKYEIHATWGVVGMLANTDLEEWKQNIPQKLPEYVEKRHSPYEHINELPGIDASVLFAEDLISLICNTDCQEIGSHTYCHYFCCDEGQTKEAFDCDLKQAKKIMTEYTDDLKTLIFPRNQLNYDYVDVIKSNGLKNYRGNETSWFNRPCTSSANRQLIRRGFRLLDNYVSISGHNCYVYADIKDSFGLNNIRSSRFLRPYSKKLGFLDPLRIKRIKSQMLYAAKNNEVFHIWWHPHNFGVNTDKNLEILEKLLMYYSELKDQYGMKSMNMKELGELLDEDIGTGR